MIPADHMPVSSHRIDRLAGELGHPAARHVYLSRHLKAFLANQIRSLRGDLSQKEFGKLLGKPQSVVSRLEDENYGKVSLQTLLDIAIKRDIALLIRFVDYPTFLKSTEDHSSRALSPEPYRQDAVDALVSGQELNRSDEQRDITKIGSFTNKRNAPSSDQGDTPVFKVANDARQPGESPGPANMPKALAR